MFNHFAGISSRVNCEVIMWKEKVYKQTEFSDLLKFLNKRKLSGSEFKIIFIPSVVGSYSGEYKLIYVDKGDSYGHKN